MLERARTAQTDIRIFSVGREGSSTTVRPMLDAGLWRDQAVDELLREPDEADRVTALVRRGWLDL